MKQFITALMAASLMGFAAISGAQTGENADTPTPVNQVGQAPGMAPAATLPGGVPQVQVPPSVQTGVPSTGTPAPDTIIVPSGASWGDPGAAMDSNSRNPDRQSVDIHVYPHYGGGSAGRSKVGRSTSNTSTKQSTPAKTPGKGQNQMPSTTWWYAPYVVWVVIALIVFAALHWMWGRYVNNNGLRNPNAAPRHAVDLSQPLQAVVRESTSRGDHTVSYTPNEVALADADARRAAADARIAEMALRAEERRANMARINGTPPPAAPSVVINNGGGHAGVPGWPPDPNASNTGRVDTAPAPQKVVVEHVFRTINDRGGEGGPRGGAKTQVNKADDKESHS